MAGFDYGAAADLLSIGNAADIAPGRGRKPTGYGRYARAADAIRFAIEELPLELRADTNLKVAGESFDSDSMRRLYESAEYPLGRRTTSQFPHEIRTSDLRRRGGTQ